MCAFKMLWLAIKNSLRTAWVCIIFALLFAVVLFAGFVKDELADGLYDELVSSAGRGYFSAVCDYSAEADTGDTDMGIYYSADGHTYGVTIGDGSGLLQEVSSYSRGIDVCKALSVWSGYVEGQPIEVGAGGIWIYDVLADSFGISMGQSLIIYGNSERSYTVCGTYGSDICDSLCVGYVPTFIIADGSSVQGATVVVGVADVYGLYLSDIGKTVTGDGGLMDLCEGYYISRIAFAVLYAFFCVAAFAIAFRIAGYTLALFSRQTFILASCGLPRLKIWALYFALFALYGLFSLCAGVGIFYILAAVTQSLSLSIMGMKFSVMSPGIAVVYVFAAYLAAAAAAVIIRLYRENGGGMIWHR